MRITKLTLLILLISSIKLFGQQFDTCKQKFDTLLVILQQSEINQNDLIKSLKISQELYSARYTDYIDSVVNGTSYVSRSLTRTYSEICIKVGGQIGVDYYLKYLNFTNGSAEEERSFALERLFVKYPEIVLIQIGKDEDLLSSLIWGFINNRYYGLENPFEDKDYTAMTVYENGPKRILTANNCEEIFYKLNPLLKKKYNTYKYQIDYIINNAKLELEYEKE